MELVTLARHAMATRFEIVLHGDNPVALRAAGEEALDEIERIEAQLSLFKPTSEIARVNANAARAPVRVLPGVFDLLERAQTFTAATDGAFDITIAPLMRCWGLMQREGKIPSDEELSEARSKVGMRLVHLNRANFTVQFEREGVMLDLGAIGKGHAIDKAAEFLLEAGVTSALIHGGTSTIYAIGQPPKKDAWKVAVAQKSVQNHEARSIKDLPVVSLKDESLSVSAVWGKTFQAGEKVFGHVIDPRTGCPVSNALLAAVALPSATETDAFSTALLTMGAAGLEKVRSLRADARVLLISQEENKQIRVEKRGID